MELKWLGEGMKQLPNNLKSFELYICKNDLGGREDNLKWLGEGMM